MATQQIRGLDDALKTLGKMDPVLRQWARITARVGIASFPEFLRHHLNSHRQYVRQKQLYVYVHLLFLFVADLH
jgi:hypothetical protein